jgi:cell shape-determining protein MreD
MMGSLVAMRGLLGAVVNLNHPTTYVQKGWFQISVANLVVIIVMVVVFVLALLLPFPRGRGEPR